MDRVTGPVTSDRYIYMKKKGKLGPQENASGFPCFQVTVGDVGFVFRIGLNRT